MTQHNLEPVHPLVVDAFSFTAPPAVTIEPGNRLGVRTLDADGHLSRGASSAKSAA